ncbi:galactose mutarotase-like protein [Gloeophyllum trabeum ATCC 11539]|uniref:Galactose mutarotase-like protein n=1 Tax=Gloeophyllum trabeum (strain ATCC 11539 / FP-39264 / Madison 617) TaxID=670483 RepID=S7PYI9_GLOTA|nr:galactose mutarotase-like protein [Gloeophyllum trabeum ATCC 11539]EPQ52513.1 galactose mutarotase-like protein [Gloeophyllum trabeum ATCC 11539]
MSPTTEQDPWQPVLLALPSLTPSLALELIPHGLLIHRLFVQADGKTHDLVIGPEQPRDHLKKKYVNTIIGRYANRLPVGEFSLEREGAKGTVKPISNESPTVSLHGGTTGFDSVPWTPLQPSGSKLFSSAELATINGDLGASSLWSYTDKDGENGFDGTLYTEVLVGLLSPSNPPSIARGDEFLMGSVVIVYRAKLLDQGKVTPLNITQHWGFNLTASLQEGADSLSVKSHSLTFKADKVLELDKVGLSAGKLQDVAGTAHDFRTARTIGSQWPTVENGPGGYDWYYSFPRTPAAKDHRIEPTRVTPQLNLVKEVLETKLEGEERKVELASEKSGVKIVFGSNQSGVQFYTNNFASTTSARKKIHGGSGADGEGQGYGVGSAAFLEFHAPLAAWLHPETVRDGFDTLLAGNGEVYNNWVKADIYYKTPSADVQ